MLQFCLLDGGFDVVALQEVTFDSCQTLEQHFHLVSNIGPRKLGTAILVRKGIGFKNPLLDPDGRLIAIDVGPITVINIYAPSGARCKDERNEFFCKTVPAYATATGLPLILLGDFNCVENLGDRSEVRNPTNPSRRTSPALSEMIRGLELVDVWTKLRPADPGHTFFHPQGSSRLGRAYFTRDIISYCNQVDIVPTTFSDHWGLHFCVSSIQTLPRRSTNKAVLWKLNTAVLKEEAYVTMMTSYIQRAVNHPLREADVSAWWESVFKKGVKQHSIRYCKERARLARETKLYYQQCINDLVSAPTLDWAAYQELKMSSRRWEENLLKGFGVRARDGSTDIDDEYRYTTLGKLGKTVEHAILTPFSHQTGMKLLTGG